MVTHQWLTECCGSDTVVPPLMGKRTLPRSSGDLNPRQASLRAGGLTALRPLLLGPEYSLQLTGPGQLPPTAVLPGGLVTEPLCVARPEILS